MAWEAKTKTAPQTTAKGPRTPQTFTMDTVGPAAASASANPPPGGLPDPSASKSASLQLVISFVLGLFAFVAFSFLRVRYPKIYVANFNHTNSYYLHSRSRQKLPRLPSRSVFGWIPVLYSINDKQVLEHAGLDAVVFLGFFKMCIKILVSFLVLAMCVIAPIRYKFTHSVDDEEPGHLDHHRLATSNIFNLNQFPEYLWMYTAFTYIFTGVVGWFLFEETIKTISTRQNYLGKQKSITDRTIRIIGIPPLLRNEEALKRHIESLGVGQVDTVSIVKEWGDLKSLFSLRKQVLWRLERHWVEYLTRNGISSRSDMLSMKFRPSLGDSINISADEGGRRVSFDRTSSPQSPYFDDPPIDTETDPEDEGDEYADFAETRSRFSSAEAEDDTASVVDQIATLVENETNMSVMDENETSYLPLLDDEAYTRPKIKTGFLGVFGKLEDAITHYTQKLEVIDSEIIRSRRRDYPATSAAFITMKSVAQAQMIAQAVLDPQVNHLITSLAPAPHDVIWDNLCLTRQERNTRIFTVTLLIGLVSFFLVFPVSYLAALLNIDTISRLWPSMGLFLHQHPYAEVLVTDLLPPYIFTIFNIVMPYFYIWISSIQGFTLHSDEELSAVSKNFFYIFVNLFLVFTLAGTVSFDTTKLASQFAASLKKVTLFYVDLIIFQGLGIYPYKLLLLGNLLWFPISTSTWCKTPRDYLSLYKPPIFDFGLQLPQPMLILIITIIYSVLSTKIVTAGLAYFVIGFFVSKYQLLYACVHPPHSTGKVWPLIFRRVILGLLIFQLTMVGNLVLQKAIVPASLLAPLPLITLASLYRFQRSYIPLSNFIALRSIENNELPHVTPDTQTGPAEDREEVPQTIDERRDVNKTYEYPHLLDSLEGPLIAIQGEHILLIDEVGAIKKSRIIDELY